MTKKKTPNSKTEPSLTDIIGTHVKATKEIVDLIGRIVDIIIKIFNVVSVIIVILTVLVLEVFFKEPLAKFISKFIKWWPSLSEGWQILIVSIPIIIITQVISNIIVKKLEDLKKK